MCWMGVKRPGRDEAGPGTSRSDVPAPSPVRTSTLCSYRCMIAKDVICLFLESE